MTHELTYADRAPEIHCAEGSIRGPITQCLARAWSLFAVTKSLGH